MMKSKSEGIQKMKQEARCRMILKFTRGSRRLLVIIHCLHDEGHGKHPLPLPDLSCFPRRFIRVYCSNVLKQAVMSRGVFRPRPSNHGSSAH